MRLKGVRLAVLAYLLVFMALTCWPGAMLINRVEPYILGLPFNLACIAALILGALGLLAFLYIREQHAAGDD